MLLTRAVREGNLSEVERLVNSGADIHTRNEEPLILAAGEGRIQVVEFLVSR